MKNMSSRRESLKKIAAGTAMLGIGTPIISAVVAGKSFQTEINTGKIRHSACRWCYNDIPLETLCAEGSKFGLESIDLIGPKDWPVVKKYGMTSAMGNGAELGIAKGWNDPQYHETLVKNYLEIIPQAAGSGIPNIICLSGNRNGMDDETGLVNCTNGLKKILGTAEKYKVNIVMELLNSKVDHKDYLCDHTAWGVELCNRIGSERFKLLYDIYHMQIMEGDVIRTIRENQHSIAHYHTGGVPGRHEINDSQELYYPAIMKAIAETGFTGFVAQEFIPTRENKLESLKEALEICTVSI
ncbi:MAG: TIM barrel protein [Cyclobacteriaceae bacterium]|nr:TIM barrel protein [Cyclobacteriaceae bacterium]